MCSYCASVWVLRCVCLYIDCLIPFGVGGLVVDVCCYVGDLIIVEAASESRHGVLSVGHLLHVVHMVE